MRTFRYKRDKKRQKTRLKVEGDRKMSKSILVIDTPKDCLHCDIAYWIDNINCVRWIRELGKKKEEICPLRPMPKRKEYQECFMASYGWNKCIDEIIGEQKDEQN